MAALTQRAILLLSVVLVFISIILVVFLSSPGTKQQPHPQPKSQPQQEQQPEQEEGQQPQSQPQFSNKLSAVCKASRYPAKCEAAFTGADHLPSGPTIPAAIEAAMWLSSQNLKLAQARVKDIQDSSSNANLTVGAKICLEILNYSAYRINQTATEAVPRGKIKDARAWMSAALSYQYSCRAGFQKFVNGSSKVNETSAFFDILIELTSNAVSMVLNYDIHGNDTDLWSPPKTEREGFWEPVGKKDPDFKGGVPRDLKANVTVCKDGNCDHATVQEAVDTAPDNLVGSRFVILIKTGIYKEIVRVPFEKRNVVFLGDGMGKTIITGSLNVMMPGINTFQSATVGITGDGFMASNLTFENTAGSDAQQAVAFLSDSDQSVIENCEFLGNQDTLYAKSLRQYYKSCHIQGNVDFIFGDSATFFQDCVILFTPRTSNPEKGAKNVLTAHGRIDPAESTGFVFKDCVVNGTEELMTLYKSNPSVHLNYLGRPWKEYSRTVFIDCELESLIAPEGWMIWTGDFALKTLYYGEFGNTGPGADNTRREKWSSQIPAEHVSTYSLHNFIQGDEWIPASD